MVYGTWRTTRIICPECLEAYLRYFKEGTQGTQMAEYPALWECPKCTARWNVLGMRREVSKNTIIIESDNYPDPLYVSVQGTTAA